MSVILGLAATRSVVAPTTEPQLSILIPHTYQHNLLWQSVANVTRKSGMPCSLTLSFSCSYSAPFLSVTHGVSFHLSSWLPRTRIYSLCTNGDRVLCGWFCPFPILIGTLDTLTETPTHQPAKHKHTHTLIPVNSYTRAWDSERKCKYCLLSDLGFVVLFFFFLGQHARIDSILRVYRPEESVSKFTCPAGEHTCKSAYFLFSHLSATRFKHI